MITSTVVREAARDVFARHVTITHIPLGREAPRLDGPVPLESP